MTTGRKVMVLGLDGMEPNTAKRLLDEGRMPNLQKMIDRCECILFLNTNQSILPYEKPEDDATDSPWIYSEIVCTQLIRHKELKEYRKEIFHGDQRALFEASEGFHPAYSVSLDHMMPLNMGDLMEWEQNYPKNTPKHHPLDYLYKQLAARN